jgi:hypothetical protein
MMATEDYTSYRVYCEHFCLQFALPHIFGAASDGAAGAGRAEQVVESPFNVTAIASRANSSNAAPSLEIFSCDEEFFLSYTAILTLPTSLIESAGRD